MAGTGKAHLRDSADVLLKVEDLVMEFPTGRGRRVHAVSGISFDVVRGETLGLVGESGCGKSTTGRAILQLPPPTSGSVSLGGTELTELSKDELRAARPRMQMIFQDPISALNPRRQVRDVVGEPLKIWDRENGHNAEDRIDGVLDQVGLDPDQVGTRRPHQFSGGQCQRISIARALVLEPELLVCDEPVSALDVSVQAQILNLLEDMKAAYNLSMIFIAHDLAVVKNISDRVAVMYLGKMCEPAPSDTLTETPAHPYTVTLLEAVAVPDPDVEIRSSEAGVGEPPSPVTPPSGCRFRTRCPKAASVCADLEPEFRAIGPDHFVACHFPELPVLDGVPANGQTATGA